MDAAGHSSSSVTDLCKSPTKTWIILVTHVVRNEHSIIIPPFEDPAQL